MGTLERKKIMYENVFGPQHVSGYMNGEITPALVHF